MRFQSETNHQTDFQSTTTLSWSPSTETFTIHRPALQDQTINHGYESAPHTLFTKKNLHSHDDQVNKPESHEIEEPLQIHLFYDKSVLEVFVNDRFSLTSRIYPSLETSTRVSCDFGAYDTSNMDFRCWEELKSAWTGRGAGRGLLEELHPLRTMEEKQQKQVVQVTELPSVKEVLA